MRLDLLHLLRSLRRSPVSAAAAIVTLSLTLGTGAAIVAVVDAVLLTPPPFANPDALVILGESPIDEPAAVRRAVPYATFDAWRERAGSLASLEAFDGTNLTLTGVGAAERLSANDVTPGFLRLLGVTPAMGRQFDADDVGRPVVIISNAFWSTRLAGDPAVIGREIVLGGRAHSVIGVLSPQFSFGLNPSDIWRPLPLTAAQAARTGYRVIGIGRLARQASATDVAGALSDVSRSSSPPARVVAIGIATAIARNATITLRLLAGAAAVATLIAFINLAGLLLVRSIDRRRELAVRSALGAPRSAIAKQLLLETVAIVTLGVFGGVLLAFWMTPLAGQLVFDRFGGVANREIAVSWQVIAAVATAAFVCACISGLLPAIAAARRSAVDVLRRGATRSPAELTLRRLFVTGEVALAFVLLVSMALLGRTLLSVLAVDPGFDVRGVLAFQVSLPAASYSGPERVTSFYSALQRDLQDRLGAAAVSIVDELPLTGDRGRRLVSAGPTDTAREAVVRTVSPGYFDVMRIPVVAGRSFDVRDNAQVPPRVIISRSLSERLFARDQPVGQRIRLGADAQNVEVIGVVGDVKHRTLDELFVPTVYLSAFQEPSPSSIIVVRSERADADVIAAVREAATRLDANLPVYGIRPMRDVVAASPGFPERRLLTAAFTGFALLAVVLSAIGLFGIAAHDVASRRAELALRIAVGADPGRLLRATLARGVLLVGSGLAVGGVLSIWAIRGLSSVVIAAAGPDVLSIGLAATVLTGAGIAAVFPAAVRAARTDPLIALRSE
jgi:putative ABC transport system permease protein